jgi:hypothetical protein
MSGVPVSRYRTWRQVHPPSMDFSGNKFIQSASLMVLSLKPNAFFRRGFAIRTGPLHAIERCGCGSGHRSTSHILVARTS